MPIYAYHCERCDREVELLLGLDEAGRATCPECGGPLERRLTAPAPRPPGRTRVARR